MNGPRSPTLMVFLMAVFILLAFLLAVTLIVTAGPVSDRSDNNPMNLSVLKGTSPGSVSQCLDRNEISVQETCPTGSYDNIFGIFQASDE